MHSHFQQFTDCLFCETWLSIAECLELLSKVAPVYLIVYFQTTSCQELHFQQIVHLFGLKQLEEEVAQSSSYLVLKHMQLQLLTFG